jgi:hypothetical protein
LDPKYSWYYTVLTGTHEIWCIKTCWTAWKYLKYYVITH